MRILFLSVMLFWTAIGSAQDMLPLSGSGAYNLYRPFTESRNITQTNQLSQKKWFVSRYSALSTGFTFFNGGSAQYIGAPLGLQLNRRLTDNWYAFAGVSAMPAYIHFNRPFQSFGGAKPQMNSIFHSVNNFGVYSRAELGLMYINEEKTFSISGSIGIQRSSNPAFFVQPVTTTPPHGVIRKGN